jgi:hypothetical protein
MIPGSPVIIELAKSGAYHVNLKPISAIGFHHNRSASIDRGICLHGGYDTDGPETDTIFIEPNMQRSVREHVSAIDTQLRQSFRETKRRQPAVSDLGQISLG